MMKPRNIFSTWLRRHERASDDHAHYDAERLKKAKEQKRVASEVNKFLSDQRYENHFAERFSAALHLETDTTLHKRNS